MSIRGRRSARIEGNRRLFRRQRRTCSVVCVSCRLSRVGSRPCLTTACVEFKASFHWKRDSTPPAYCNILWQSCAFLTKYVQVVKFRLTPSKILNGHRRSRREPDRSVCGLTVRASLCNSGTGCGPALESRCRRVCGEARK
jgi:hypothetical protein